MNLGFFVIFFTMTTFAGLFTGAVVATPIEHSIETPEFIRRSVVGNKFAIETSNVALKRSQNAAVLAFAQKMLDEHRDMEGKIKVALADTDEGMLPTMLDKAHRHSLNKLKGAPNSAFDKMYIKSQVKSHREAIALFKKYAQEGGSPKLKSFAAAELPELRQHQKQINALNKR